MEEMTNVKFRLSSIEKELLVISHDVIDFTTWDEGKLKFQYKIETIIRLPNDIISVIPTVRYTYEDREALLASSVFNFAVPNLSATITVDKENQQINVRADIFPTLLGNAYSTLRGIVYARTDGSELKRFPLPMIDARTLVEKNGISVEE